MKTLEDFREEIHKCSKCGLCQAECPIYKITGNDCSVSRGQFVMLQGVLKGELKLTKTINRYLNLCLKCGACSKFCPAGIDIVDIILAAKYEYFRSHYLEKIITFFQKYFVFGFLPNIAKLFKYSKKSKNFSKKVLYFGGCGSKFKGNSSIIRILNSIEVEVISPDFHCCGIPYLSRGDLDEFNCSIKNYIKILKKYDIKEVVTSCASCEKSLKDYIKWVGVDLSKDDIEFLKSIRVRNIYEYIKESNIKLKLQKPAKITYHKPCNINNWGDIDWLLRNTENLEYIQMQDFDKCCGLNGLSKFNEYKIMSKIFESKRDNIRKSGAKAVTTSCLGCEIALRSYSLGQYRVEDLLDFLAKSI